MDLEAIRKRLVVANVSGGKDSTALSLHLTELGSSTGECSQIPGLCDTPGPERLEG